MEEITMYYKVSKAAEILNVSKGHVRNLIRNGSIKNVKKFGNIYRISKSELEKYICGSSYTIEENTAPTPRIVVSPYVVRLARQIDKLPYNGSTTS
jgi:excisionase family DNA binding protein